jgi:hypothetical protein
MEKWKENLRKLKTKTNEIVWEGFVRVREWNHRVSVPMVQEYAKTSPEKLGETEFKASNA